MNNNKDDVWTIKLPYDDIVLTRYLYLKDEVKNALLIALLKKSKSALFWAYELYYSGFQYELIDYLWNIYYDFYAILNVTFEAYLLKKFKEWKTTKNPIVIGNIIDNLLVRPFNSDIFLLKQIVNTFDIEIHHKFNHTELKENIDYWLEKEDYYSLACEILSKSNLLEDRLYCVKLFMNIVDGDKNLKIFKNIIKYDFVKIRHIILAKCFIKLVYKKGLQKGKSIYIKENDYSQYDTIDEHLFRPYNILKNVCKYNIDEFGYQSLFNLVRDKYEKKYLSEKIINNWAYQASFSPIWFKRIKDYNGWVNFDTMDIQFIDEDYLEKFYNNYDYELDEQPLSVKNNILNINLKTNNWTQFICDFGINKFILINDNDINELKKITYN